MAPLEIAVIVLGTVAVRLLSGTDRSCARRRLAALRPAPARTPRLPGLLSRQALHWSVPFVPALTLTLIVGPFAGFAAGVPIGCALWWGLRRADTPNSRLGRAGAAAGLPIAIDLLVAGLRAGGSMTEVLTAVTDAVSGPIGRPLGEVAEQLRLGADPAAAWRGVDGPPELTAVGRALARAADSGAPIADILERQAAEIRGASRNAALARSQRLGVLVVAPLGLCFLPAFVLIGIVPLAAGLVSGLALS
ncbi:MAG: type II secretion system F family protein [Nocardiopsaceae bacterium]|nr:type II secretion system F family protein [Nocardiopsaceae bacterium]